MESAESKPRLLDLISAEYNVLAAEAGDASYRVMAMKKDIETFHLEIDKKEQVIKNNHAKMLALNTEHNEAKAYWDAQDKLTKQA